MIIPYIGATMVTVPVCHDRAVPVGSRFGILLPAGVVYFIIQALDGNVLVPLLFSEAVNLHPVAIILAVVFFGGIWGMWGVFFAIPLATLVKAIINAWPRQPLPGSRQTDRRVNDPMFQCRPGGAPAAPRGMAG